jgi:hypothetical protein
MKPCFDTKVTKEIQEVEKRTTMVGPMTIFVEGKVQIAHVGGDE